jgi:hypothetical protein
MTAVRKDTALIVAQNVARSLASCSGGALSAHINTPLLFPSGSSVVIRIDDLGPSFFVTDMGMGFQEAELMGAPRTFKNHAETIAERAGVGFDREAFFMAHATRDQLVGVVTTIANCSLEAAVLTAFKIAEDRADNAAEILQERLTQLFSPALVAKDAEVIGASATPWKVAAIVRKGDHTSLFDVVSPHPNSVAAAVTKFVDIAELPNPPKRIAVVRDRSKLGTRLTVLQRTASVIELTSPDSVVRRAAA